MPLVSFVSFPVIDSKGDVIEYNRVQLADMDSQSLKTRNITNKELAGPGSSVNSMLGHIARALRLSANNAHRAESREEPTA